MLSVGGHGVQQLEVLVSTQVYLLAYLLVYLNSKLFMLFTNILHA